MPRMAKELSALKIKNLAHHGMAGNAMYAVGGVSGLHLQITQSGGRSWLLRVMVDKLRRDIGLGGFPTVTLAIARDKAREARAVIEQGKDPLAERRAIKAKLIAEQGCGLLFSDAFKQYLAAKMGAHKNAKHSQQWENTLRSYVEPKRRKTP